ncbi:MAG: hypothetical protein HFH60_00745 [Lachnospiraceae bacterium]|nr:hypothetical protein [Lachnospiraceae bacterium]
MNTYEARIQACIEKCLQMAGQKARQSSVWFENFRKRHDISSLQELDREIFFRMYAKNPRPHEIQKIRFWRLKQHLPRNRAESIRLGQALELSGDEMDRFLTEELHSQRLSPVKNKKEMTESLFEQYLRRIPLSRLKKLHIRPGTQRRHLRHIFFAEALDCLDVEESMRDHCYKEHLYSRNFASEFKKFFEPDTIISRENILRFLILVLIPDLDTKKLNEWLTRFGYAPLSTVQNASAYVDHAIGEILDLFKVESSSGTDADKERMEKILRLYDHAVKKRLLAEQASGNTARQQYLKKLRFIKFRSIGNDIVE